MSVSLFLWKDSQLKFLPELSVEGGYRLSESTVMAQYIADKHSKSHLKYCDVGFGINGGGEGGGGSRGGTASQNNFRSRVHALFEALLPQCGTTLRSPAIVYGADVHTATCTLCMLA